MSASPRFSNGDFAEEKRKLYFWISQLNFEQDFQNLHLDISELTTMFQILGFRLQSYKKNVNEDVLNATESSEEAVRMDIMCLKSGMKSTLFKQTQGCKCPAEKELENGQFWCISGIDPSSQSSINSSNSSLLPTISRAKEKLIRALTFKILSLINTNELTENEKLSLSNDQLLTLTRHRSLDVIKSERDLHTPLLTDQRLSWEVDPKTTPPIFTSSPILDLCNSLSHATLNSEKSAIVLKSLKSVKQIIDDTLQNIASTNNTFVKTETNAVPNENKVENSSVNSLSKQKTFKKVSTPVSTAKKNITPKKLALPTSEKIRPISKIATFSRKTTPQNTRKDTPTPLYKASPINGNVVKSPAISKPVQPRILGISKPKSGGKLTPAKRP